MDKVERIKYKLMDIFIQENKGGRTQWEIDHILVNIDEVFRK